MQFLLSYYAVYPIQFRGKRAVFLLEIVFADEKDSFS